MEREIRGLGRARGLGSGSIALQLHHIPLRFPAWSRTKNDAGPRMGPAPIQSQSTFLANSEGALRLWALLSQDAGQAAHGLQLLA
jgi:hypothetical protein